jgi:hypothetical protein
MNSAFMKLAIAYIAGIGTYALYQNYKITDKVENINTQLMSADSIGSTEDDSSTAQLCPCDNAARYNVDPRLDSKNIPIPSIPTCSTMVHNVYKGVTPVAMGAWFSKVTLDIMFCNKPDANGIYVYRAVTDEGIPTYVIEAARTNAILSTDDGSSYIYYSKTMCPTACGACGM